MKRFFIVILLFVGAYFGQALIIFPGMWASPKIQFWKKLSASPNGVERFLLTTPDDEELEVWHLPAVAQVPPLPKPRTALFFHGEKSSLRTSFGIQKWLASIGVASYGFDYRGFGASTGWPSERGMIDDGETVFQRILDRDKAWPEDIILVGDTAGAAIAAELAARHRSRTLLLLSPFANYLERLGAGQATPVLEKLIKFRLSTAAPLEQISGACVILTGLENGPSGRAVETLAEQAKAKKNFVVKLVSSTSAGTGEMLRQFKPQLQAALSGCAGS